ncbi:MAG TPA: antibiotic biosynthesis monooxygenase [Myxococcaceae bacterium]|jgi:quinol monooxygenase YgiN
MGEILGIARINVHEGKLEEYKRLAARCMESVRTKDSGTLQYDLYFSERRSEFVVIERYRDSEALLEHVANLGETMGEISAIADISGEILGSPSGELLKALEAHGVGIYSQFQSI